mgnify:CR=1 FL=1
MSRANKCQTVSNRMRNLSHGSYTDIYRREAEQERKKKANLALHIQRSGGRKW